MTTVVSARLPRTVRLAIIAAACSAATLHPTAQTSGQGTVAIYTSRDRPIVLLTIDGSPPLPVLFDTGTTDDIIDPLLVAFLKLTGAGTSSLTDAATGRSIEVPLVQTPLAKLGGVPLTTRVAQVLDLPGDEAVGIFGPNSFGDKFVILEGPLQRIRLVEKGAGWSPSLPGEPYKNGLPTARIEVAGEVVIAHLDSGNDSALVLGTDLLGTLPLTGPPEIVAVAQSALGNREVRGGTLGGDLTIGPLEIKGPKLTFGRAGHGGNVGLPIVRQLNVVFDPVAQVSWIMDPAEGIRPLESYVGTYGDRVIAFDGGRLSHRKAGRPDFALAPLGLDTFEMPATGDRIQFLSADGKIVGLDFIRADGSVDNQPLTKP